MQRHWRAKIPATHGRRTFLEAALGVSGLVVAGPALSAAPRRGRMESEPTHGPTIPALGAALGALARALPPEARAGLTFPFGDEERFDWHFVPRARKGVSFGGLDPSQREAAHEVLRRGLSPGGYETVTTIVSLETVLRELEGSARRDPDLYFFRLFGEPGARSPWGWSFEGHHVSLNYAVVGDRIATTPLFLGANPAEVRHGPRKGLRALAPEEDLARALLKSLDAAQRNDALVADRAPADILTGASRQVSPVDPAGLAASRLSGAQADTLMTLLETYAATMPSDVAARRMGEVRAAGLDRIHFAWAGGAERGQAHYYRVQGPGFLVEYDNIQNDANHIHTVWRDFAGDFGRDLLAEHRRSAHRPA